MMRERRFEVLLQLSPEKSASVSSKGFSALYKSVSNSWRPMSIGLIVDSVLDYTTSSNKLNNCNQKKQQCLPSPSPALSFLPPSCLALDVPLAALDPSLLIETHCEWCHLANAVARLTHRPPHP